MLTMYTNKVQYLREIGYLSIFLCCVAECCCNYAMFTTDYLGNVIEASLWAIAISMLLPYALRLHIMTQRLGNAYVDTTHVLLFSTSTLLACTLFTAVVVSDHVPLQFRLWKEQ